MAGEDNRTVWVTVQLALIITASTFVITTAHLLYTRVLRSLWHLRHIPRPKGSTFVRGHGAVTKQHNSSIQLSRWLRELGPVIRFESALSIPRVCTTDKAALHHILIAESYNFPKPVVVRRALGAWLGQGLVITEGQTHSRQRKIMSPSFGAPQMKEMFPIFMDKSLHLRDTLLDNVANHKDLALLVDIYDYANRATLDVISAAGFGHNAQAIDDAENSELFQAFNRLFGSLEGLGPWETAKRLFPALKLIPDKTGRSQAISSAHDVIRKLGLDLLKEKKDMVLLSSATEKHGASQANQHFFNAPVRSNMAADLTPQQRLSDEEVMAQISTFLLAGNDTTANAITWALFGMCSKPGTQERLRAEVLAFPSDSPSYDELNALQYLDAVVRETLRVFSPVPQTTRVASKDCVIPLSKPFIGTDGVTRQEIFVPKHTNIMIPILPMNIDPELWGPDSDEFRPERWVDGTVLPEGARDMPSVALPTFLAGPRACIGYRFSILEMKTMLFSLIRVMDFSLAVPAEDIEAKSHPVMRPRIKSRRQEGWQLPLLVKAVAS
ncbi:cytochrome P450 [Clavulina sp. PMI_390]|nr:cytochrome P450 [Clavulina sp. PMI_390]